MLKKFLTVAAIVAGIGCFAASGVRVDLNATSSKVSLKSAGATKGLKVIHAGWIKDPKKKSCYLLAYGPRNLPEKWTKFYFSFIPNKDGMVRVYFRGAWHKPKGSKKNVAIWTAYDNITITGTEAKNCDFEFVNQKNLFDGWGGNAANMVTGAEDAKSGKNYVIAWHNSPVVQTLKVKKDQKVTITFFAKTTEGPKKAKSNMDNI